MNQDDRRSQVCVAFSSDTDASVGNFQVRILLGSAVAGKLSEYLPESLKAAICPGVVKQELKAVVTDTGKAIWENTELVRQEGLVLLDLSNGDCKVGRHGPVPRCRFNGICSSPLKLTLFKRDSAEFAKI